MEKYVILRSSSVSFGEFGPIVRVKGGVEGKLSSVTTELSKKDIQDLRRDPEVVSFAPNMLLKVVEPVARDLQVPTESNEAWGVRAVGALDTPFTGQGVKVAVLDTGIDADHPAFSGVKIVQKDFTGEGNGDKNGHGTHCAGTIFGQMVEGLRIGVAPGIDQAFIGKILGSDGGGATDGIVHGIMWALDSGANVISMSLSMDFPGYVDSLVKQGLPVNLATSKGLETYRANINLFTTIAGLARSALFQANLIIAASGNESRRNENPDFEISAAPPASAEGIYSVGALEQTQPGLSVAFFSNTKVNIAAPGVNILSARAGGGLTAMSGTSMATPHVAGVAALWADKLLRTVGNIDTTTLAAKLLASGTIDPLVRPFDDLDVGTGIVQAPRG